MNILFWDDVFQDLAKDDDVFFKHYPQFGGGVDLVKVHDRKLFEELTKLLTSDADPELDYDHPEYRPVRVTG